MTIYQKLLHFYLASKSYFDLYLEGFFHSFDHLRYYEKSLLYYKFKQKPRIWDVLELTLPDSVIQDYFFASYSQQHLFSIIFAHIWSLEDDLIKEICAQTHWHNAWELLHRTISEQLLFPDSKGIRFTSDTKMMKTSIEQQLLCYYLDSYFGFQQSIELFFFNFLHEGECGTPTDYYNHVHDINANSKERLRFQSQIYIDYKKRLTIENGYHLTLQDKVIVKYFETYSGDHLAAIIFSRWYKFSRKQFTQIANCKRGSIAFAKIQYFLCYPEATKATRAQLKERVHPENYTIFSKTGTVQATYTEKGLLKVEDTELLIF